MKILNVIPYWGPEYGGVFTNAVNICANAIARGHEASILTTASPKKTNPDNFPWFIGNTKIEIPIRYCGCYERYFHFSPEFVKIFDSISAGFDLVLIHGLWQFPTSYAAFRCKKSAIPYAVITYGMLSSWSLSNRYFRKKVYFNLVERSNLDRAKVLFYIKEDELNILSRYSIHAKKIHLLYSLNRNDVVHIKQERDEYKKENPSGTIDILYLSRIHPKKGLMLLLEAFLEIMKTRPSVKLTVAGPAEDMRYYNMARDFVTSHKLDGSVTFAGALFAKDKDALFLKTDIFVLPTADDSQPIVVLEALGAGIPVITTKGADMPEIDNTMGYIIDPNPHELAKVVTSLADDKKRAKEMGEKGHQYILAQHTWDKNFDIFMEECKNAVSGKETGCQK